MAKKRGKISDFLGKREDFLLDYYPTYAAASKKGKTREIWTGLFLKYWAAFPWRLPLNQDTNPVDLTDYGLAPQGEEETNDKGKLIAAIEQVCCVASFTRLGC